MFVQHDWRVRSPVAGLAGTYRLGQKLRPSFHILVLLRLHLSTLFADELLPLVVLQKVVVEAVSGSGRGRPLPFLSSRRPVLLLLLLLQRRQLDQDFALFSGPPQFEPTWLRFRHFRWRRGWDRALRLGLILRQVVGAVVVLSSMLLLLLLLVVAEDAAVVGGAWALVTAAVGGGAGAVVEAVGVW